MENIQLQIGFQTSFVLCSNISSENYFHVIQAVSLGPLGGPQKAKPEDPLKTRRCDPRETKSNDASGHPP